MDLNKLIKYLKISLILVILILSIFVISLFIQYPHVREDIFGHLGIIPSFRCSGTLSLSKYGTNECTISAKVITSSCYGKNYEIKEGSCFGSIKCQNLINYDSFQATCIWKSRPGHQKYFLCVDNKQLDSKSIVC